MDVWSSGLTRKMSLYKPGQEQHANVPLRSLIPGDASTTIEGIKRYVNEGVKNGHNDKPPEVVKYGDKYIILDGHHRLASEIAKGRLHGHVRITGELKK